MRIRGAFALPLALIACGGSSATVQQFLGSWTSVGSELETCGSDSHTTPLNGLLMIGQASASGQVMTMPPNGCNLNWAVNGNTASLGGTQTCTVPGSVGGVWTATFTSGTLNLNGNVITFSDQGSGVLNYGGAISQCTFTQSGTFSRN